MPNAHGLTSEGCTHVGAIRDVVRRFTPESPASRPRHPRRAWPRRCAWPRRRPATRSLERRLCPGRSPPPSFLPTCLLRVRHGSGDGGATVHRPLFTRRLRVLRRTGRKNRPVRSFAHVRLMIRASGRPGRLVSPAPGAGGSARAKAGDAWKRKTARPDSADMGMSMAAGGWRCPSGALAPALGRKWIHHFHPEEGLPGVEVLRVEQGAARGGGGGGDQGVPKRDPV